MLEFVTGAGLRLGDGSCTPATGAINAKGTSSDHIVFRGISDGKGAWLGIGINSSSTENKLIYCEILGGGGGKIFNAGSVLDANVALTCDSKVTIQNTVIEDSGGYGIFVQDEDALLSDFTDNTLSENTLAPIGIHFPQLGQLDASSQFSEDNGMPYIEVTGTRLDGKDLVIPKLNLPYRIKTDDGGRPTYIEKSLEIAAGVVMEFETGTGLILGSKAVDCIPTTGSLRAVGTAEDSIIFRSVSAGQGNWIGIGINSNSANNLFKYCEISGGGSVQMYNAAGQGNIVMHCKAKLDIQKCLIKDSGGWGIDLVQGGNDLTESDNTFDDNASGNIAP